jgi:hypothetical protein
MEIKKIEVNLSFKPHQEISKKLVISFFNYLLHIRSQIPFNFSVFEKFIDKSNNDDQTPDGCRDTKLDWKTKKQLRLAHETYEKIRAMHTVSCSGFFDNDHNSKLHFFR